MIEFYSNEHILEVIMNRNEFDILNILTKYKYKNPRDIAEYTGFSLGKVNSLIFELKKKRIH